MVLKRGDYMEKKPIIDPKKKTIFPFKHPKSAMAKGTKIIK
jgi:hypothetical protein